MKQSLVLAVVFVCIASTGVFAQLDPGCFGIGAQFAGANSQAQFVYSATHNISLHLGVGYTSTSVDNPDPVPDPDAMSSISFGFGGKYYLADKDVDPYLGIAILYQKPHDDHTMMGFNFLFGAQTYLVKKLAIYSHVGIGYSMETVTTTGTSGTKTDTKTNVLNLFTGAIGAYFYF